MKKQYLFNKIDELMEERRGFGLQGFLDKHHDGSCPCFRAVFEVDGKKCEVRGRCWRVSENAQDLHFRGPKEIGMKIKECLNKQEWYNDYTLIMHRGKISL